MNILLIFKTNQITDCSTMGWTERRWTEYESYVKRLNR